MFKMTKNRKNIFQSRPHSQVFTIIIVSVFTWGIAYCSILVLFLVVFQSLQKKHSSMSSMISLYFFRIRHCQCILNIIFRLCQIVERCCRLYSIGSTAYLNYTRRNLQTTVPHFVCVKSFFFYCYCFCFCYWSRKSVSDSESAQYICFDLNSILMSQQETYMKNNNIDQIEWRISLFCFSRQNWLLLRLTCAQ